MSEVIERPQPVKDIVIGPVPGQFLAEEFIANGPMIARAAKTSDGRYDSADLLDLCWDGKMLLWVVVEMKGKRRRTLGVLFTEIAEYPQLRALRIRYAAGIEMAAWVAELYTAVLKAAEQEGCDRVEGVCRPGWARVLRKFGVKPKAIVLEFKL